MNIAYTLYRVSTKKQVDKVKDDIPMQREACREFAERMGWEIGKEFLEKGVSGFKVSASNRDAIQDLKAAAINGEFQILLVFMFDRIGRIDDEKLNMELKRFNVQLEKLNDEIANSLTGDSVYSPEQLSSAINSVNGKITEAQLQLEIIENEMKNKKAALEAIKPTYERFVGWSAEFLAASNEHKKMIISQVISRIEIGKGYVINLELNVPYKRFCGQGSVDNVVDGVTVN